MKSAEGAHLLKMTFDEYMEFLGSLTSAQLRDMHELIIRKMPPEDIEHLGSVRDDVNSFTENSETVTTRTYKNGFVSTNKTTNAGMVSGGRRIGTGCTTNQGQ